MAFCPWLGEESFVEGGQFESVTGGKADEVGIGGVFVVGFR